MAGSEQSTTDGALLKEVIAGAMDGRNVSIKKITETTGIPERFVVFFLDGELRKLPAAPYVRGYLTKIARVLDLDQNDLFSRYQNEIQQQSSGPLDRLPSNRFAIQTIRKKMLIGGGIVLALFVYGAWNANKIIGTPALTVTEPTDDTITTTLDHVTIAGTTDFNNKLTINNEQIYLAQDGSFTKDYSVQEGLTTFSIVAKKFLGREVTIMKKVIRQIPAPEEKSKKELPKTVDKNNT